MIWYSTSSEASLDSCELTDELSCEITEELSDELGNLVDNEKYQDCTLCDNQIDTDVDILHRCKTCEMVYCNPCTKMFDYVLRQESHQLVTRSFIDHRCLHCYFDYTADMVGRGVYKIQIN